MKQIYRSILTSLLLVSFLACEDTNEALVQYIQERADDLEKDTLYQISQKEDSLLAQKLKISRLEKKMIDSGLINIKDVDSTIQVDVKYTTTDNFVGKDLYGDLNAIYFQPDIAERLQKVQESLKEIDSSLSLLIFDGTRPRSVQQKMWEALDTIPVNKRVKFVSNPKNGSIHNYGCAVDLTIMNIETKDTLDMGAGFDDPRRIAYPKFEKEYLKNGELTQEQVNNRYLLRKVMGKGGFWVLPTEWWHFNGYSRAEAKEKFSPIE